MIQKGAPELQAEESMDPHPSRSWNLTSLAFDELGCCTSLKQVAFGCWTPPLCAFPTVIGFPSCCFQGIEEATGIPSAKQQLKLVRNLSVWGEQFPSFPPEGARFAEANQKLLAEGDEKQSSYEVLSWEACEVVEGRCNNLWGMASYFRTPYK